MVRSVRVSFGFRHLRVYPVVSQQATRAGFLGTGQTFGVPYTVSGARACRRMHIKLFVGIPSSRSS
ncbi:hypothetical protein SMC1_09170 [Candidatus Cryosericum septentrionale]|uniref:Uncharacterized protein n=1 Tax=Candidatus Cryosericum septentrionale TaxID=2290913 RepID=A0A398DNV8_9BACT|nr:hypothetical protein SMC1_09170 [Candidatus Cryosericum septentrionale]